MTNPERLAYSVAAAGHVFGVVGATLMVGGTCTQDDERVTKLGLSAIKFATLLLLIATVILFRSGRDDRDHEDIDPPPPDPATPVEPDDELGRPSPALEPEIVEALAMQRAST